MSTDVLGYISVRKEATLSYDSIVAEIKALPTEKRWNLLMMLVSRWLLILTRRQTASRSICDLSP